MGLKKRIWELADKYFNDIVDIRRHLHQYPELSFREHETTRYIEEQLNKEGLNYTKPIDTGLTGLIRESNSNSGVVALRADIDALPIHEKNTVAYTSKNPGIMHACGHDAHTASLIGAIKILK